MVTETAKLMEVSWTVLDVNLHIFQEHFTGKTETDSKNKNTTTSTEA